MGKKLNPEYRRKLAERQARKATRAEEWQRHFIADCVYCELPVMDYQEYCRVKVGFAHAGCSYSSRQRPTEQVQKREEQKQAAITLKAELENGISWMRLQELKKQFIPTNEE